MPQPSGELTPEQTVLFAPEEEIRRPKSPAIKFAERKAPQHDQLDHPELDLASLDKAHDS